MDREGELQGFWSRRRALIVVGCLIFVAWTVASFVLAVIALSKENKVEIHQDLQYNQIVTYQLEADLKFMGDNNDLTTEFAVSIKSDGTVRLGGGSTIYQNVVRMKEFTGKSSSLVMVPYLSRLH